MENTSVNTPKKLLYEVSIIRPLVIFLLVLYHSFVLVPTETWNVDGYKLAGAYDWLTRLIWGFRIETIALIAGYVFSYQSHDLGRSYSFWPFVWKKFKRLIIPMLVFGIIYYFCFIFDTSTFTTKDFFVSLFTGCGHLWFLPMLFWCFLAIWVIDHFKLTGWWLLILLAGLSMVSLPNLPFGFRRLPHFVFYVYGGYFLWTKRDWLFEHFLSWKWVSILWLAYVLIVVFYSLVPDTAGGNAIFDQLWVVAARKILKLLMAVCGIMALYLTVCMFATKEGFHPKPWVVAASDNCYGVYVYHQFILEFLYFHTLFVSSVHPLLVPWAGFAVFFVVSLILTKITLKTKPGRFLIG